MDDMQAWAPNEERLATIDWRLPDGRVAMLLRLSYHVTAELPTPGDWCVMISNPAPARPFGVPPYDWRWLDGAEIGDINAVGLKSWQTVTRAPTSIVDRAEEFLGTMKAARTWERRT